METPPKKSLAILGGGPAGLAAGYFAQKQGQDFTIFEKKNRVGGNCITLQHGDFLFDSGAHRLHHKDPEITDEIKSLLGQRLQKVEAPSQIYDRGRFIDFPLSPLNLLISLGIKDSFIAACDLISARMHKRPKDQNFETFAIHTYGRTIAERFLLNYSQKLWGAKAHELTLEIAGKRLKGLDLRTFITEAFLGKRAKTEHLERSSFFYPQGGFGTIVAALAQYCKPQNIHLNSAVTRIVHQDNIIRGIEVNNRDYIDLKDHLVINTLPVSNFISMLDPQAPQNIIRTAQSLEYRHMILVCMFLNVPSITKNATIYFPGPDYAFTRAYEPKNRSDAMAPKDKTALVIEIPCHKNDQTWAQSDAALIKQVIDQVIQWGWIQPQDIMDTTTYRFEYAYPILKIANENKVKNIMDYLSHIRNLKISGRNGKYLYAWFHDMMRFAKDIIETCQETT